MNEEKKAGTICRVCLDYDFAKKPGGKGLSLFAKINDCIISDQINALTNVAIKEGDGLPDMICAPCLVDLVNAVKFKQKCESTNETLLSAVYNAPTQLEYLDVIVPMKEEYLHDTDGEDYDYVDDNITLADLQAAGADIKPLVDVPKPSKAIDLKLICNECGGSFKSKCKIRVHWKRVHLPESLKCPNCLRIFKSFASFQSHIKNKTQSCETAAKVRIEGEGKKRVFYCKDCDYKSIRIKDAAAHIITHSGERPYQCELCAKAFTQLNSLNSHKESAHKIFSVEGTCHYCGKHIQGRTKLYRHVKSHMVVKFPCKICSSVLKTKAGLRNHMRRHAGIKEYACETCPSSFFTGSELYNHKSKVHLKNRYYKCDVCQYKSTNSSLIAKHIPKHLHYNYSCSTCGKFVDNEQQLVLHMRRHTDRNNKCPHCEKTYFSRKNLGAHVRKVHRIVQINGGGPKPKNYSVKCESSY